jgi:molybdenum cofactor cytidylyltransferase
METSPTAGIILAAGTSSRLGRPKQLVEVDGRILLSRTVAAALASKLERVVLVLGHEADRILACLKEILDNPRIGVTVNYRYREGMSGSLRHGLLQVCSAFPAIMVILGDHPLLDSGTIDLLLDKFNDSEKDICVSTHSGRQGHPVIFSSRFYKDIMNIKGDVGARDIVRENPDCVLRVEVENEDCFLDIDTEEDLASLHRTRLIPGCV